MITTVSQPSLIAAISSAGNLNEKDWSHISEHTHFSPASTSPNAAQTKLKEMEVCLNPFSSHHVLF